MAEEEYYNKKWRVEDFERYHSGKMPETEMYALEKAALDDPFLEDALEGYAYAKTPEKDIEELKNKLSLKKDHTRVIWYKQQGTSQLLKIAAFLLLFLGFAWLLNNNPEKPQDEIASISRISGDTVAEKASPAAPVDLPPVPGVSPEENTPAQIEQDQIVPMNKQKRQEEAGATELIAMAPRAADADSQGGRDISTVENRQLRSNEQSDLKLKGLAMANENKNDFRGRVVDNAGKPVPFASISDKTNNQVLATDQDGYFSLNNRQNTSNIKVDVNALGFETTQVALAAGNTENKIVLKDNNQQLSEVVIGYGANKNRIAPRAQKSEKDFTRAHNNKITLMNAMPVNGWESFNRFINDSVANKRLPAAGYKEVVLSFNIDSLGKAQNIAVKKSISDSSDEAARQILRSIPAIKKIKKGKKAEVVIRF